MHIKPQLPTQEEEAAGAEGEGMKERVLHPNPETRNPNHETRNPKTKPEARNLKPETRNPKLETPEPKSETCASLVPQNLLPSSELTTCLLSGPTT